MKRAIARWQTWWLRLFVLTVLVAVALDIPTPFDLVLAAAFFALSLVRPPTSGGPPAGLAPSASDRVPVELAQPPSGWAPVQLAPPVRGRWVAINSPGTAVPSHGVKAYGQAFAVDLLMPTEGAPAKIGWSLRTRAPRAYACFGAPVLAMAAGTVVRAVGARRDHRSRDTWPSLIWMMTVEAFVREVGGAGWILGNHVIVEHDDGTFAAYAHLRKGSPMVRAGERVAAGQQLAEVGNTGNTSEPHLHVQLMDRATPTAAAGLPMLWRGLIEEDRDPRWSTGEPKPTALAGFPESGRIFTAPAERSPAEVAADQGGDVLD
ncbi:M23 family metallopeptidase [Actinoplanes sp. NPDC049596]|uniref:M23 family metallopeptidase n=1 Tax=unclassified Actinoplanes TaxID=2626549 RepID=UPI00341BA244